MKSFKFGAIALAMIALPLLQGCRVAVSYGTTGWYYGDRYDRDYRYRYGDHWRHRHNRRTHLSWRWNSNEANFESQAAKNAATLLSRDYRVKYNTAAHILYTLNSEKPELVLSKMGLTVHDVAPLQKLRMPSGNTIYKIAHYLGEDHRKVKQMMAGFIRDVSKQRR